MVKIKVSGAQGAALDYLVAVCEGHCTTIKDNEIVYTHPSGDWHHNGNWSPSTKWVQGGPIIDALLRTGLVIQQGGPLAANDRVWVYVKGVDRFFHGDTLLIAAMRCYVASKLGEEVEVPDELLESTKRSTK